MRYLLERLQAMLERAGIVPAPLEEAGFPTFTLYIGSATVETLMQEFLNVGTLLGQEETAQQLYDYWETKLAMVEDAVAQVPEEERKVVYYISSDDITSANTGTWTWPFIEIPGGICAAPEGTKGEINVEDVINWDPDVILLHSGSSTEGLYNDNRIQDVSAVANGEIYVCPTGAFWWDCPCPEAPLAFMWLAKTLYPEYTQDIDLKAETKEFFAQFYQYELSDEEYESFFQ